MGKIKLLLVDDHAILRAGLKALLNAKPDIEVVAEAADAIEAVHKSHEFVPDIVLMDISMPGLSGLEATQEIKKQHPEIKILVLTMHEDIDYLSRMIRAGASGYVPKKAADTELLEAIRATNRGENFIHSSMTAGLVANMRNEKVVIPRKSQDSCELSQREKDVLHFIALGHTDQETADLLYLSIKTVQTYKTRIKEKLGFRGRAELVRYATQMGLLDKEG